MVYRKLCEILLVRLVMSIMDMLQNMVSRLFKCRMPMVYM